MVKALLDRLLALAWRERALVLKLVSFASIGVVNTLIDFSLFWIAVQWFAVPIVYANMMSWSVAITHSYVMNSFITFARESGRKLRWRAYAAFLTSGAAGLVTNTITLLVALRLMPQFLTDPNHQLAAAKACAIVTTFAVDFSLSHFFVFRRRPGDDAVR